MKPPFDDLADLLATPEGLRTARLLQAAGLLGAPASAAPPPRPRPPEPISIWEPREAEGETVWVRPDPQPLGDHFAATKILRHKRAELPLRVGFFGESVAAGYLYAPHVTPARVLEGQLRAAGGSGNFEVVDLARTNETLASLAETVRTAVQIQPDVLVLFAGNNWNLLETPEVSPYAPSVLARRDYGEALREEGIAGPVRRAAERLRAVAGGARRRRGDRRADPRSGRGGDPRGQPRRLGDAPAAGLAGGRGDGPLARPLRGGRRAPGPRGLPGGARRRRRDAGARRRRLRPTWRLLARAQIARENPRRRSAPAPPRSTPPPTPPSRP